jgi:FkbM family methyltransferase
MFGSLAAFIQRRVARSTLGTHLAIKLKHQCDAIMAHRLGSPSVFLIDGELWLIEQVAPAALYFVDVGANVGQWSCNFAKRMRSLPKGLAFEPAPGTALFLRQRLTRYPDIDVVTQAAGETSGEVTFYEEAQYGPTSSAFFSHSSPCAARITVPITTLDVELSSRHVDYVDFLKIDAEGLDFSVMLGSRAYLRAGKISVLQFEYNSAWVDAGATLCRAYDFLRSFDYDVLLLKGNALFRIEPRYYGEYFRHSLFVAVHKNSQHLHKAMQTAAAL